MQTPDQVEEVKSLLLEAGDNHSKIYLAICHGMRKEPSSGKLSVILGKNPIWANQFRYIVELTDRVFTALHDGKVKPVTAKMLAELVDQDQEECLKQILGQNLVDKRAKLFVQQKVNDRTRNQRITAVIRHAWPEKKIVSLTDLGVERPAETARPTTPSTNGRGATNDSSAAARAGARSLWSETTGPLREYGVMPKEVMEALFGDGIEAEIRGLYESGGSTNGTASHREQAKIVIRRPSGHTNGNGNGSEHKFVERVFLPYVVGNERIVSAIVWILCQILKLMTSLNSIPAPRLAAAMLDPVDEKRIRNLTRQIGDQVALSEDLLEVAAKHRH